MRLSVDICYYDIYLATELKFSLTRSMIYFGDRLPMCAIKRYKIYRTSRRTRSA